MRIVADENVDRPVIQRLREDGHEVVAILETEPGASDHDVLESANASRAVLLTADRDFGELAYRLRQVATGVVLIRLAGLTPQSRAQAVSDLFRNHELELENSFTVLTPGQVRIRPRV